MQKPYFIFDLDNTLVKTNRANNKSYEEAIKSVTGIDYRHKKPRFTRGDLSVVLPQLSLIQITDIIKLKEDIYDRYIQETLLNQQLFKCLKLLKENGAETILMTDSHKTRAEQVCNYHKLGLFFTQKYYKEDYDGKCKYLYLKSLNMPLEAAVLFENESKEIRKAKRFGISKNRIITIRF